MSYFEPEPEPFYKRGSVWAVLFIVLLLVGGFWLGGGVEIVQDMASAESTGEE